ncbi:hypothetical protein DdX_09629 [Ditylenchus destructor]|uniref:Uncharacterized protein n=1 Tax=Ditylenchus destructor TaxID=166010 RepID=A0AAD4R327_9BILA|nr:hypothetical protein DdX_09629 [Ditylenchus destructor]
MGRKCFGMSNSGDSTLIFSSSKISFPFLNGWQGADVAYSIALGNDRHLWLFGDTFVGSSNGTYEMYRNVIAFPRNSIGILFCDKQQNNCSVPQYYWSHMGADTARAFFDTYTDDEWYWPPDGFVYNDHLHVLLSRYHATNDTGPTTVLLGTSVVIDSQFLYCFSVIQPVAGNQYTALTRLSLGHLKHGAVNVSLGQWEFLNKEGNWLAWKNASQFH